MTAAASLFVLGVVVVAGALYALAGILHAATIDDAEPSNLDALDGLREPPCMVLGCDQPVTVAVHGWLTCTGHDRRDPFDQAAATLADEVETYLRGAS